MTELEDENAAANQIAIIGMACRVPGANTLEEFWRNLCTGAESITRFAKAELLAAGHDPALIAHPDYVPLGRVIAGAEQFDAGFFGFTPREAELLDPQQRLFLECAHEALESSGYGARESRGPVGVYAGSTVSSYLLSCLLDNPELRRTQGLYQMFLHNDKDFLATRVAYKLDLRGPCVNIQTACSTSLVAVHLACQALLEGECELALAGGASVRMPQQSGYLYQPDMIFSPDGRGRAFDAQAAGTVSGDGVGVVVLKRLEAARADRDPILAVIRGSAINNDGANKIGYTAPSTDGQTRVIREALLIAGTSAETISYLEAHGTGTPLGDPIEVAALTRVFRGFSPDKRFCALGALKDNVGHMDAAAGVGGLIKTVLMLQHRQLPPSPNFQKPNPKLDLDNSPFYINTQLVPWPAGDTPRRAGVSAFGIGGTNAHVIVEEAPAVGEAAATGPEPCQLLTISARSEAALGRACQQLAAHLERQPALSLADAAYTLHVGREPHALRRAIVCADRDGALRLLREQVAAPRRVVSEAPAVAFLFPGGGAQYPQMARELYATEPTFREELDRCAERLKGLIGGDLRQLLYSDRDDAQVAQRLQRPQHGLACLFAIEYAMARLLMSWGVAPQVMLGHSMGEYVAACLAGVFRLEDALALVARRGQLFESLPAGGAMLAVPLPAAEVTPLLGSLLAIAAINTPAQCTVAGPEAALDGLALQLAARGLTCRRIHIEVAAHSPAVEPILGALRELVRRIPLSPPQIPIVSSRTGALLSPAEATDPEYWVRQLRDPVRFADGLSTLLAEPVPMLVEIGPGNTLTSLASQHPAYHGQTLLTTLRHPSLRYSDRAYLLAALGALWTGGSRIDWPAFHRHAQPRRIPLPTYPFERQRYYISPQPASAPASPVAPAAAAEPPRLELADWCYLPLWKPTAPIEPGEPGEAAPLRILLLCRPQPLTEALAAVLAARHRVVRVQPGSGFARLGDSSYTIAPQHEADHDALGHAIAASGFRPDLIVHALGVAAAAAPAERLTAAQQEGLYGLLWLTRMLDRQGWQSGAPGALRMALLTCDLYDVTGEETLRPEQGLLTGWLKTAPREYPGLSCRSIDVHLPDRGAELAPLAEQLADELTAPLAPPMAAIAYRRRQRYGLEYERIKLAATGRADLQGPLRPDGVYLITGGLGGVGLALARALAQRARVRLVLLGRTALPPPAEWPHRLAAPDCPRPLRQVLAALAELERLGAQVLTVAADVSDRAALSAALAQAKERFGTLHGVIHAAGEPGGGAMLRQSPERVAATLAPKVAGTMLLDELLADTQLDFMVLCSALVTAVGAFGHLDYTAANGFLDAFAAARTRRTGQRTLAIDWNRWQGLGMAVAMEEQHEALSGHRLAGGMSAAEGGEVFLRLLGSPALQRMEATRILVCSEDLAAVLRSAAVTAVPSAPASTPRRPTAHPRPELAGPYVAPQTPTQAQLVAIIADLLGVQPVGTHDNFFTLGGSSLVATRLVAQARAAFQIELSLRDVFEAPDLLALAQRIETARLLAPLHAAAPPPLGSPGAAELEEGKL